jgi:hypothetical protein
LEQIGDYSVHGVADRIDPLVEIQLLEPVPDEFQLDPSVLGPAPPSAPKAKVKRKRPSTVKSDICDMFSLQHVGERTSSICSECFFRGHISSSRAVCPKLQLLTAIEKSKHGNSWRGDLDKYNFNREQLGVIVGHMKSLGDVRHVALENVVTQYDLIVNGTLPTTSP